MSFVRERKPERGDMALTPYIEFRMDIVEVGELSQSFPSLDTNYEIGT